MPLYMVYNMERFETASENLNLNSLLLLWCQITDRAMDSPYGYMSAGFLCCSGNLLMPGSYTDFQDHYEG